MPPIPDARPALGRLSVEGAALDAREVRTVGLLLDAARLLGERLDGWPEDRRTFDDVTSSLHTDEVIEVRIRRTVDTDDTVLDTASSELRELRRRLRGARQRIVKKLEAFQRSLPDRLSVADGSVSVRDGRYVVPIRREGKGEVGGIIHDESATGATLFVEPPIAIELMNEVRELERAEEREVRRVLREISTQLRANSVELQASLDGLVAFDSLFARARTAQEWGAAPPVVSDAVSPGNRGDEEPRMGPSIKIVGGRHPLLLARGEEVVPFDLEIGSDERALVVSGPNTGGKSVFLKSIGLIHALVRGGCMPPVREGSHIPVFSKVFADIGDGQSIAESLSTFSAHLMRLGEVVSQADRASLVLIDEMGTGTDPSEGAALSRAILEELVARGATVIVTSHLGALKTLDTEGSAIANGSFEFDPDQMRPTYTFVKGRPGRSYGLAIARRSGFPGALVDRAERHLSEGEASVDELLESLQRDERAAREGREAASRELEQAERVREQVVRRERAIEERERVAEKKASAEARKMLMEARSEVEEAIRELRERDGASLDEAARVARRRIEAAANELTDPIDDRSTSARGPEGLEVGMRVVIPGSGSRGTLVSLDDLRATVEVGGLRIEVPARDVAPVGSTGGGSTPSPEAEGLHIQRRVGGWSDKVGAPAYEIDLRGLRVDEVEMALGRGIDAAVVGGLDEIRIVHGKGTGALRSRVEELLPLDGRVSEFRSGLPGEGGSGVTVAKVR